MTSKKYDFSLAFALGLAIQVAAAGCASGQSECHPTPWSGTCHLLQVTKVREVEFPLPAITLEALYRPQPASEADRVVPGDVQRQFTVLDQYEDALRTHLDSYKTPRCYVNPPPPGQCQPGALVVEVPDFDVSRAQTNRRDLGPKGCAQIESTSAQDKVTQAKASQTSINERFEFGEDASDLAPDSASTLDALAARIKQAPNLQCVGVIGAWVRGESLAIAFARARAVRDALVQRGVEPERLIALTVDPPLGNGSPEPPDPKGRRVTLSVLLDLPPSH